MPHMDDKIRIGVVGAAGEAAEGHIRGFQSTSRAEVTTVGDLNYPKLRDRAAILGIPNVVGSVEELVNADNVDAVVVATPDHLHAEHVSMALSAGKHVLCEKPTSTTRADAARLVELVRTTGKIFLGGHVYHFRPDYRLLAEAYRRGDIGTAWLIEGDYVSNLADMYGADGRTPWRSDATHPQDIMLGGGCHPMGLMRWVLQDEVVEVTAYSNHLSEPVLPLDDCYVAILRFAGGAIGRLTTAAGSRGKVPDGGHVKVRGTTGSLWSGCLYRDDTEHHAPYPIRDFGYETKHIGPRVWDTRQVHYWAEQAEHFLDCVQGKAEPQTSVVDSARVVSALTACVESARTHRPVTVDNNF
jgi:predicted dehydrogenase